MMQNKPKNLAEVCPQCYKLINSSENRLVHDTCGHLKCRICLLQEIRGCLHCVSESDSSPPKPMKYSEPQRRKSVITSLALQRAEQRQREENKSLNSSVDQDTCHVIKQSLEKDILFPTEIVQRSTSNFYHLKRVFSQRFFNEDNNNKRHKACETEEKWPTVPEKKDKSEEENVEKKNIKFPSHITVQYYCNIHETSISEKSEVLKNHMLCKPEGNDNEDVLHQCNLCEKSYKELGKLNRHMKSHTRVSKFKCGKCGKACTDNYALKTHERTHTQLKPYACDMCDKKFSALQNFRRHERQHKNEKNYTCKECQFRFLTKIELKRHSVTHTNVKPFVCSHCSTKFAFKRTLIRHLRTHDKNLSRIKCAQCESTFKRKDNLERHIKLAHCDGSTDKNENENEDENDQSDQQNVNYEEDDYVL